MPALSRFAQQSSDRDATTVTLAFFLCALASLREMVLARMTENGLAKQIWSCTLGSALNPASIFSARQSHRMPD